jgi:tetratricopeptide (TPR) repeat protein
MTKVGMTLAASAVAVALFAGMPAGFAAGGSSDAPSAPAKAQDPNYTAAVTAIQAKDYKGAIPLLNQVVAKDPKNADAFNYLGYSHRQLGQMDQALSFYDKALAINPDHRGAHEYLGELYLQKGDVKNAEVQLAKLDDLCTFGCEEYRELKRKIAAFKSGKSS